MQVLDPLGDVGWAERHILQLHLACFDLRHVEDVVENVQQRLARPPDRPDHAAMFRIGKRGVEHFGHAEHTVERRSDLVAHIGEKHGFRAAGLFRAGFGKVKLRHVRPDSAVAEELIRGVKDGLAGDAEPAFGAVRCVWCAIHEVAEWTSIFLGTEDRVPIGTVADLGMCIDPIGPGPPQNAFLGKAETFDMIRL